MTEAGAKLRLDKWLWQARFFKTRSLAARQVSDGQVRLNGVRVQKPAQAVGPGDVLTFAQGRQIRVVRIEALGSRRGPAAEAQALYTDLSEARTDPAAAPDDPPDDPPNAPPPNPRYEGKGRPEKKDRRALDLSRRQQGE